MDEFWENYDQIAIIGRFDTMKNIIAPSKNGWRTDIVDPIFKINQRYQRVAKFSARSENVLIKQKST